MANLHTSQLPYQLTTLGETSGAQWMALRDQSTRWVDDGTLATIGDIAIPHHFVRLALLRETQAF
jgi:hypothetical protein